MRFTLCIIALILGVVLYRQFSFEELRFKHTGLALVYLAAFGLSVYFLAKNSRKSRPS